MSFDGLLGNQRLKENLTTSLRKGRASHFYLITGPRGSGKHTLAKLLAAALMCQENRRPCLTCGPCRKIMSSLHPDFITVEDPDHKYIPVDMIRRVRDEMFIRPNEGSKKIYLLPQAMRTEAQNALEGGIDDAHHAISVDHGVGNVHLGTEHPIHVTADLLGGLLGPLHGGVA